MDYEEFRIEISGDGGGRYFATILDSPFGRARCELKLPFGVAEIEQLLPGVERRVREIDWDDAPPAATRPHPKTKIGIPLFQALFAGAVGRKLAQSMASGQSQQAEGQKRGLRIRLLFGRPWEEGAEVGDAALAAEQLVQVAALPWEFLCESEGGFLTLDRYTPIVRSLDVGRLRRSLQIEPPLHLLMAAAQPTGSTHLDLMSELEKIRKAIESRGVAKLEVLEHATYKSLRQSLERGRFHALHFMGHGVFRAGEPWGSLIFERENGARDAITAPRLAARLSQYPNLRLVCLNACSTATFDRQQGKDPYTSVAAALTQAGIPAVIAMQFPISDKAAIEFSSEFYAALRSGAPVEMAMTEGRLGIADGSLEWATPVLFLSSRDGKILDFETVSEGSSEDTLHRVLKLGIRTYPGWGEKTASDLDRLLALDPYFEGRYIREPELWHRKVFPQLGSFLLEAAAVGRPLRIAFAAHPTIAFAAGYYLEEKSELAITIDQPGAHRTEPWSSKLGTGSQEESWLFEQETLDAETQDLAVAISVSSPIGQEVENHLRNEAIPVQSLLEAIIRPETVQNRVKNGAHAWSLARELAGRIAGWRKEHPAGMLHLFASASNAFMFYLGQFSRSFGTIQLYEYDFENVRHGRYEASLSLPPWFKGTELRVLGIPFQQIAGVYLAKRALTATDWERLEGQTMEKTSVGEPPQTGRNIADCEALLRDSRTRVQAANPRTLRLRLPTEEELRKAFESLEAGTLGLGAASSYEYCTTRHPVFRWAALKGTDPDRDILRFHDNGPHHHSDSSCILRPVLEVRSQEVTR